MTQAGEDTQRARTARGDGRALDQLRPVTFQRDYTVMAPGSVLVTFGQTKVLCTASVEDRVPPWMRGSGKGWVTAEYSMLPGSTPERASREAAKGKQSGRTQEIQRLIARSLRAVCDLVALGEVQVTVDCDVLQADGGTRTASICGAYVALHDAFSRMQQASTLSQNPLTDSVAAISVGIIDGVPMLDLPYTEDSRAEVDMNVVMTGAGRFVEVQGTAEGMAFSRGELDSLLGLAEAGLRSSPACRRPCWPNRRRPVDGRADRMRLVLASANPDKVAEIAAILSAALDVELIPRPADVPDVVEDGETLLDNARLKAVALVRATGSAAVADDTGLEVDALGGAPGVYSARYAGEDVTYADNVDKLLAELGRLPDGGGERTARFRTVALAAFPDGGEVWTEGQVEGTILLEARGSGGFGYDPVFVPTEGDGRTFAEMSPEEKHGVSHRGRAFRALATDLAQGRTGPGSWSRTHPRLAARRQGESVLACALAAAARR